MRRIAIDDALAGREVAAVLRSGGVAVLPTDTLYGFSTRLSDEAGYRAVRALKSYEEGRRFVHLADSLDMVERYVGGWGCTSRSAMGKVWPGPLTAILPAGRRCPHWVGATVGLRVPDHPALLAIIAAIGEPIVSTSVNRAGEPPLADCGDIARRFGPQVALIVDGGILSGAAPSTVVDFTGRAPVLVRQGSYPWATDGNPSK